LQLGAGLAAVAVLALITIFPTAASGSVQHVRWDIISFVPTDPPTFNPGGFADAKAPDDTKIRLTGSGTFVASGNRPSGAVTGGGTWQTFAADGTTSTGSGSYVVSGLVTFEFANLQTGTFTDNIGDTNERANGTAVLRIRYSDGTRGVLTVGCHGPGAPDGIFEGIAATKGFKTYYNVQPPVAGVDANRTLFHVAQ
jgi:hypothetical protein